MVVREVLSVFSGGYLGNVLRIDLSSRTWRSEPIDPSIQRKYLGGRGVAARYYLDEIPGIIDPSDPANKLFFFTGPLTGTQVPASGKFQCSTVSSETGRYLCSNSSGNFGPNLKFSGYDGLIIEGKADRPVYIWISDGQVEIRDAAPLWGLKVNEVVDRLKEMTGDAKISTMVAGPAAERGVRFSSIQVDGRSFGRGGAGGVMAGKNLKAVAAHGTAAVPVADAESLSQAVREAVRHARETKALHTKFGTAQYTEVLNTLGCYPTRNFQTAVFDGISTISADYMEKNYKVKSLACFRCPVACAQLCEVKEGKYAGMRSDPEYETIGSFGGQCGISDFGVIVAANALCDEYGLDTMSTGTIVAYAMELFERGFVSTADTGGLELRFGNGDALIETIHDIAHRKGFGDVLAEGFRGLARRFPGSMSFMMQAKWMPFAAYEPRAFHGIGLSFGTSSRGACHNVGGWTIRDELLSGEYDRFAIRGKGELVKRIQDVRAYVDSLVICTVVRSGLGFTDKPKGKVLEYVTGIDFTPELLEIGERIYTLERVILAREGVRRKDDMLPERIMTQPLPEGMAKGRVLTEEMYAAMLDEYYAARGWDEQGVPTRERLLQLRMDEAVLKVRDALAGAPR
ncbi:MAG: aldehyde ferredoxin oxidoreductase family protein [Firmicutes bacterium]|jgi:aldehyde:ferredoxin oxidoreductase|nr:aldehyde ferredoxin oxidoreductase family protein [Bacillota bacterium]MDH7494749.1 aldehyde ferredoxin oxidoreductase family protein [Bacillota bacterium]